MVTGRIDELLQAEWPSTKRQLAPASVPGPEAFVFWDCRLTPGFPVEWPFPQNGALLYYAYAAGRNQRSLRDGEWTTIPWARFVFTPHDGNVKFERLANNPRIAAIQGVRPLRPEEVRLFDESKKVFAAFADAPNEMARESYRFWIGNNGVIAGEIRPAHTAFFEWLR
jgi:hypothetical protein